MTTSDASATSSTARAAGVCARPRSTTVGTRPSRSATASAAPASAAGTGASGRAGVPRGTSATPAAASTVRRSSASVGASGPAPSQSTSPVGGSDARPNRAGWSPSRSASRAPPRRPSTSAHAAASTDVPEPPLGDHKARSTAASSPFPLRARAFWRARWGKGRLAGERKSSPTRGACDERRDPWAGCQEARRLRGGGGDQGVTVSEAVNSAAFFDRDKTIIAKSSVLAFGRPFYREGLLSRRSIVKSLYAQVVFMLVGADADRKSVV